MPDFDHPETTAPATPRSGADQSTAGAPTSTSAAGPPGVPARIGRFEVRKVLGEGAFGRVYHAFDPELHRDVAIKVPHPHGLTPAFRERFLREARATATIHHPNVCPIYEIGTEGETPFIVMHFVHGGTLSGLLAQRRTPFPPRHVVAVVRKLALGVAAAHAKGVIHRDLKPQNVLWDEASREVLVTDFGLARIGGEAQLSRTGDILGTPAYMAPEQARGKQAEVGPLCDVYSLGVILYRMLTNELPFQGSAIEVLAQAQFAEPKPPSAVHAGLDPRLDAICLKAMAKKAEDRHPSAKALADALGDYLRKTPSSSDTAAGPTVAGSGTATAPPAGPADATRSGPSHMGATSSEPEAAPLELPPDVAPDPGRRRRRRIFIWVACVGLWCLIAAGSSRYFWEDFSGQMAATAFVLYLWGVWLFGGPVVRRVRRLLGGGEQPATQPAAGGRWKRIARRVGAGIGLYVLIVLLGGLFVALVLEIKRPAPGSRYPSGYYADPKSQEKSLK